VVLGVLAPLLYLLLTAFDATPSQAWDLLVRYKHWQLLINTTLLAGGVLVLATCIAFPLAWLVTRSDLRPRGLITLLGVLPLAIPGYVMAYALLGATGQYGVLAQSMNLTLPRLAEGYWGATLALALYTFPYLFLNLRSALEGLDPALEEQARSLGHGPWRVFLTITLPQLRPAFQAGGLLVALHSLSDFGVVSLMRYETFSYALYRAKQAVLTQDGQIYLALLGLLMLALTAGLVIVEARLLRNLLFHRIGGGTARSAHRLALGWWRWPAYGFVLTVGLVSVILPAGVIGYWMQAPAAMDQWQALASALWDSLVAAGPAAILGAALAYPLVHLSIRRPSRWTRAVERVAYFGYATPPLVLGLAVVTLVLQGPGLMAGAAEAVRDGWPAVIATPTAGFLEGLAWLHGGLAGLYQTLIVLVAAYTIHFVAEAIGPIRSALYQVPPRLEETGRSLNHGPLATFFRVTFPLIRRGLLVAVALVFLSAMKELPLTYILQPPGFFTLALEVWDKTGEAMFAQAAPYALTLMVVSALFVGILLNYGQTRK
jgi:iron(III) transport system permease protein